MREKTVGIIGLGLMGQAFSTRLQRNGFITLGYDINDERCNEFGREKVLASPIQLAEKTDTLILCLFDAKQVHDALLGQSGLLLTPRDTPLNIICTSTCEPEAIRDIADACTNYPVRFIEMPISGTSKQVANGDCLGLTGGDEAIINDLSSILDAMCKKRMHVGDIGSASKAKLAINLVLGLHRAALAEGLVFGSRIGLDPDILLNLFQNSAAASSVMSIKGPLMTKRKYDEPQSRVDQSLKDFGLIQKLATQTNQPLPLATQYIELLQSCLEQGEGKQDNAIIFEAIRRRGSSN
ncbi:NAD(P)-dependent oxidoreductase [Polynucleobacter sinensis]|jgi:putative dehydrogenase|uniref:NAD(P)-dependent oxidoreductase n=1 Tax=Polynucleobacter sinensis TaxID=1743157 RepID=UPI00078243A5|nr:NAD(P)-dependent oxidoreductase [Polynucleobacter sinensis]